MSTCALVTKRAQFLPARDEKGRGIPGSYANQVRWTIPENSGDQKYFEMTARPEPGFSVISFVVGTDGLVTNCKVISGPNPNLFTAFALPCGVPVHYPVYTDAAGKPVSRTVRMTIGVTLPGSTPAPRKKRRR